MSRRKQPPPPRFGRGDVAPVIECYSDEVKAGAPIQNVDEWDAQTGMMKPLDPQPPHPFPEAAAAWLAAQAAKAAQPEATPPADCSTGG